MRFFRLIFISLLTYLPAGFSQSARPVFYSPQAEQWADSLIKEMTPERRIAQLFMVATWSNKDSNHVMSIDSLVADYGIGGLIFFQGGPVRQALLTNHYQQLAKIPGHAP
jgi:beta-N-acetylhexosaminidase